MFSRYRSLLNSGLVLALSLAQGVTQFDRDALRRSAEGTVLRTDDRRKLYSELRKLVLDETASPDDRCDDFFRAITVVQRVDPAEALAFSKLEEGEKWPLIASPKGQGRFACGVAIANLANRQNERALEVLKGMSPQARASDPQIEGTRAHCLLLAAVSLGRQPEASEAMSTLFKSSSDERLRPESRAEYLLDVLRVMFDQGGSPAAIARLVSQGEKLASQVEGEAGDQLGVYLVIVKAEMDFEGSDPADTRIARLAAAAEKLRERFREFEKKYDGADPAVIMAAQGVSSINLELAPYRRSDAVALERESIRMCDFLIAHSTGTMVEPERVWFIRGIASAMLGDVSESRRSYGAVDKIHAAAGLGPGAGLRFSRRLALLAMFGDNDPRFVAKEWSAGIDAFANHVRALALRNPDLALSSLDAWNPLDTFGSLPRHGSAPAFLEGYIQATGLVKNVPYRRKGSSTADEKRLYGRIGLADVQAKLTPQRPLLVYVHFHDPLSPYRSFYGGFRLDGKSVKYVDLGSSEAVDEVVAKWRKSMRDPLDGGEGDPKSTGRAIYDRLLRPLFPAKLPPSLWIVADQGLEQLSFASLRTPQSHWVVQDCAVGYLGAIRDLVRGRVEASGRPSSLMQGDVYRDHGRLGEAALSLKALRSLDASTSTQTATREALRALRSPRYLHLSVHGESRAVSQPLELADASALILPGPDTAAHDLSFTAREVAGLRLEGTRCVLLAACSAAKSGVLSGEGIGGLRRAFYIAGARSVIASLLLVPETTSSLADRRANGRGQAPGDALLSKVYGALAKGQTPAQALRYAQLRTLASKETSSPRYWGGFICEGE